MEFILASQWADPPKLSTGIKSLDLKLGGGLPTNGIIEISGESGSGKTQLCLQLSLTALSQVDGGSNECVMYISTEDIFPSKRLQQLISCSQKDMADKGSKIYIEHIPDYSNLKDCLKRKIPRLMKDKALKLLVIDSVAALFRGTYNQSEGLLRTQDMRELGIILLHLNTKYDVCVVAVNQAAANFISNTTVPALGLAWGNLVTTRVQLHRLKGSSRKLQLLFSPSVPDFVEFFEITDTGLVELALTGSSPK